MSNGIKPGDLVVVVKPTLCCGSSKRLGKVLAVVDEPLRSHVICSGCGRRTEQTNKYVRLSDGKSCEKSRLIKIDPPAEGDSLQTRANLDQPVTA